MNRARSYKIALMLGSAMALIFSIDILRSRTLTRDEQAVHVAIYAYPLVLMEITKKSMTQNGIYLNTFINVHSFPTDRFNHIVRPNVDTLYSFAWLDLNKEPLILNVPEITNRYYIIQCLDAWTNVFASLGTRTTGTDAHQFIIVGPDWKGQLPPELTRIQAPTNLVLLLGRTHTHGPSDYEYIHTLQSGYTLTPLSKWKSHSITPSLSLTEELSALKPALAPVEQVAALNARDFYTIFLQALAHNPAARADEPMLRILTTLGIFFDAQGQFSAIFEKNNTLLQQSLKKALHDIEYTPDRKTTTHGWLIMRDIGTYGTRYLTRARVAYIGIGANLPEDALYPTTFVDKSGAELTGKNAYRIHFTPDQLPPVNAFWSLTVYNQKSFLVPNILNRYSLNDKDPLMFNPDGSLDLYLQHQSPGAAKEANWLPTPVDEFNLTLRLYWPHKQALEGTWQPPAVEKIKA